MERKHKQQNSLSIYKLKNIYTFFISSKISIWKKLVVLCAFIYVISPIDLMPDFIMPVICWLDDIGVAGLALKFMFSEMNSHKNQTNDTFQNDINIS